MSELLHDLSKSRLFVVADKTVQLSPIDTSKSAPAPLLKGQSSMANTKFSVLWVKEAWVQSTWLITWP